MFLALLGVLGLVVIFAFAQLRDLRWTRANVLLVGLGGFIFVLVTFGWPMLAHLLGGLSVWMS